MEPKKRFQGINTHAGGPVRQPYSYSVPSPHRLFKIPAMGTLIPIHVLSVIYWSMVNGQLVMSTMSKEIRYYNVKINVHSDTNWTKRTQISLRHKISQLFLAVLRTKTSFFLIYGWIAFRCQIGFCYWQRGAGGGGGGGGGFMLQSFGQAFCLWAFL
jgi:hypothetical protein